MSVHDESEADAYADHVQLQAIIGRGFDPYKVTHISSRDAKPMSVSMPEWFRRAIDSLHGNGRRFRNRSEFVVHACAVAYKLEQGLLPEMDAIRSLYDPVVERLDLEHALEELAAIDKIIEIGRTNVNSPNRTLREKTRVSLHKIMRICEDNGDDWRVGLIKQMMS